MPPTACPSTPQKSTILDFFGLLHCMEERALGRLRHHEGLNTSAILGCLGFFFLSFANIEGIAKKHWFWWEFKKRMCKALQLKKALSFLNNSSPRFRYKGIHPRFSVFTSSGCLSETHPEGETFPRHLVSSGT